MAAQSLSADEELLVAWLTENNFQFLEEAFLKANYTLETVKNMTEEDIGSIFKEKNIKFKTTTISTSIEHS